MDGLREVEEELGLRVSSERLEPLGSHLVEQEIPGGCDRELHDVFLLSDSTPPDKLRLQREEVESVVRIPLDAVEGMSGGAAVSALEYTEGAPRPIRIRISDFVADKEEYLFSVARESRRVLAGERAGRIF